MKRLAIALALVLSAAAFAPSSAQAGDWRHDRRDRHDRWDRRPSVSFHVERPAYCPPVYRPAYRPAPPVYCPPAYTTYTYSAPAYCPPTYTTYYYSEPAYCPPSASFSFSWRR
jgi:hypothetical protein